uniref:Uncharacterized protein n=1 Tax=Cacopsylla melanoneura TaxID=428564 RepID=A0A8D8RMQ5_9HEMI
MIACLCLILQSEFPYTPQMFGHKHVVMFRPVLSYSFERHVVHLSIRLELGSVQRLFAIESFRTDIAFFRDVNTELVWQSTQPPRSFSNELLVEWSVESLYELLVHRGAYVPRHVGCVVFLHASCVLHDVLVLEFSLKDPLFFSGNSFLPNVIFVFCSLPHDCAIFLLTQSQIGPDFFTFFAVINPLDNVLLELINILIKLMHVSLWNGARRIAAPKVHLVVRQIVDVFVFQVWSMEDAPFVAVGVVDSLVPFGVFD